MPVEPIVSDAGEPYYTTIAAVRASLALNTTQLPDAEAVAVIETAEDLIDELLGAWPWPSSTTTGRKILQTYVQPWQWAKLTRATTLLAADIYQDPAKYQRQRWNAESGPDFSVSGPLSGMFPRTVLVVLNQSGLRRLAIRGRTAVSRFDSFFVATRHDGT